MSRRTLDLDDTMYNYVLDNSLREHPAQTALRMLNRKLHGDERVDLSLLPISDGLTLARKR
jgi:predicted O-methyltransferase YrrM